MQLKGTTWQLYQETGSPVQTITFQENGVISVEKEGEQTFFGSYNQQADGKVVFVIGAQKSTWIGDGEPASASAYYSDGKAYRLLFHPVPILVINGIGTGSNAKDDTPVSFDWHMQKNWP